MTAAVGKLTFLRHYGSVMNAEGRDATVLIAKEGYNTTAAHGNAPDAWTGRGAPHALGCMVVIVEVQQCWPLMCTNYQI